MKKQQILFSSYFDIDLTKQHVLHQDQTGIEVLNNYIIDTLDIVVKKYDKCQLYELIEPENGYVYEKIMASLNSLINTLPEDFHQSFDEFINNEEAAVSLATESSNDILNNQKAIANRLLREEIQVNHGAISIRQGALIQSILVTRTGYYYVLIKNEFFKGISRTSFEEIQAFLYDSNKKSLPLKIAIFNFSLNENGNLDIQEVSIDDGIQAEHSPTWYEKFLELKKRNSDSVNTMNCANSIVNMWDSFCADPYKSTELRNITIGYLMTHDTFILDEYIHKISVACSLTDEEKEKATKKIKSSMSTRKGFDCKFSIVQSDIKDKFITKKIYPLKNKKIYISVKGKIHPSDIKGVTTSEGNFIMIRSDDDKVIASLSSPNDTQKYCE